ncbi:MAG: hypothetical protein CMJ78_21710 [Planctomycetaceae bacterium]|nr:hypothetical protein [Planctomycetaceae bacterium]
MFLGVVLVGITFQFGQPEPPPAPSQEEVHAHFASIVDLMESKYIEAKGETVSNVKIAEVDESKDTNAPLSVEIAPIKWYSCGCCSDEPIKTPFFDNDLAMVSRLDRIQALTISRTSISDSGISALAGSRELRKLSLRANHITDESLKSIARIKTLEELDLSMTQVTGSGLKYLKHLPNLRVLNLEGTPLEDAHLRHLGELRNLEILNLASTPISGVGFAAVDRFEHVKDLNLQSTKLTAEGSAHLPMLPSLVKLNATSSQLGDGSLRALAGSHDLETVWIRGTNLTNDGLRYFRGKQNLKTLSVGSKAIDDDGLKHLAGLRNLHAIDFNGTSIMGEGVVHLRECRQLGSLSIDREGQKGIRLNEGVLETIAGLRELSYLKIDLTTSPDLVVKLDDLPKLRMLEFYCGDAVNRIELSNMPRLERVSILRRNERVWQSDSDLIDPAAVPKINAISLKSLGSEYTGGKVQVRLSLPERLEVSDFENAFFKEITGVVTAEHGQQFRQYEVARINALPKSDPKAVVECLSGPTNRYIRPYIATDHWTKEWSDAFNEFQSTAQYFTLQTARIDEDAPIPVAGLTQLEDFTLIDTDAKHVVFQGIRPGIRELEMRKTSIDTLELFGHAPLMFKQVRKLDRLISHVGKTRGDRLYMFGGGNGPALSGFVCAPKSIELHDFQNVKTCSLRCGNGIEKVEIFGRAPSFHGFQFVPSTIHQITWGDRAPGRWQGEFDTRRRRMLQLQRAKERKARKQSSK